MRNFFIAAVASLALLTADVVQAQTSSRHQPVSTTRKQSWRHRATTRTDHGRHKGWEQGKHEGWTEVTDSSKLRWGGYHGKKAPIRRGKQKNK